MSSKKKKKYYVVWVGQNPGIYDSWDECKLQIQSYPNARYKKFTSRAEAEKAFTSTPDDYIQKKKKPASGAQLFKREEINYDAYCVDAACSGNPGDMEYRGVKVYDHTEIFRKGPFKMGTNNVGEFLALVHMLALLDKQNDHKTPVYSDSKVAINWVRRKKCNTKLKRLAENRILFNLISRAENWLKKNTFKNKILKWDTYNWGEIPADFGRK